MREIKFKAYAKAYNKIVNVDRLGLNSDGTAQEIIVTERELGEYDSDEWTDLQAGEFELLQCTSIKDKNGAEIYEGDIVKKSSGVIGQVAYLKATAGFKLYNRGQVFDIFEADARYLEILGNIYENPGLLKDKR